MKIPAPIVKLIDHFERLPGIGPKTAQRLTFQLLHFPQSELETFAGSLTNLKAQTKLCEICKNVSEHTRCLVCDDDSRDKRKILVVATPLDLFALEKSGFKGVYHVLHGIIDPLNNIGPDEIFIGDLLSRVAGLVNGGGVSSIDGADVLGASVPAMFGNATGEAPLVEGGVVEVILATNSSMEGESTAMYITRMLREKFDESQVRITRIARGLPVGGDIEYADDITLSRALDGRSAV